MGKNKKSLKAKASKLFRKQDESSDAPPVPSLPQLMQAFEGEAQVGSQVQSPVESSKEQDEFNTFATESETEDNVTSNISVSKESPKANAKGKGKMKKKPSLFLRLRSNTASGSGSGSGPGSAPPLPPPPVPPFPYAISSPIPQSAKSKVPPPRPPRPTDPRQLPYCIGVETEDGGFVPLNRYVTPRSQNSSLRQRGPSSPNPFTLSISSISTTPILKPEETAQLPGTVTPSANMPEPLSALQNYRNSTGSTTGYIGPWDFEDRRGQDNRKTAIRSPPVSMYAPGNLRDNIDARRAMAAGLPTDSGKKANHVNPMPGDYQLPFSWQLPNMERVVPPGSGGPEFQFTQKKEGAGGGGEKKRGSGGSGGGGAPPGTLWKDENGFLHFVPDI